MPHLRFTRDKRGYENTYVVHSVGRRGRTRQRILYWFRTPPNVRVGRAALDEDAIRAIEEHNPDIVFDWNKILEAQPPTAVESLDRRRAPRGEAARGGLGATSAERGKGATGARAAEGAADAVGSFAAPSALTVPSAPLAPDAPIGSEAPIASEIADLPEIEPPALVPVTVYHGGADVLVATATDESPRVSPVEARLGSELLGRVRARYAEIMARITERVGADPSRLEEMRRTAEVLNPDSWVTELEIAQGLQQFDARLGEIRRALGIKRRRRSRRGGRRRHGRGAGQGARGVPADATTGSPVPPALPAEAEGLEEVTEEVSGEEEDPNG